MNLMLCKWTPHAFPFSNAKLYPSIKSQRRRRRRRAIRTVVVAAIQSNSSSSGSRCSSPAPNRCRKHQPQQKTPQNHHQPRRYKPPPCGHRRKQWLPSQKTLPSEITPITVAENTVPSAKNTVYPCKKHFLTVAENTGGQRSQKTPIQATLQKNIGYRSKKHAAPHLVQLSN